MFSHELPNVGIFPFLGFVQLLFPSELQIVPQDFHLFLVLALQFAGLHLPIATLTKHSKFVEVQARL